MFLAISYWAKYMKIIGELLTLLKMGYEDFISRDVTKSHAELYLKVANKLLFVVGGITIAPLFTDGKMMGPFYVLVGPLCFAGCIIMRNLGYELIAELENSNA